MYKKLSSLILVFALMLTLFGNSSFASIPSSPVDMEREELKIVKTVTYKWNLEKKVELVDGETEHTKIPRYTITVTPLHKITSFRLLGTVKIKNLTSADFEQLKLSARIANSEIAIENTIEKLEAESDFTWNIDEELSEKLGEEEFEKLSEDLNVELKVLSYEDLLLKGFSTPLDVEEKEKDKEVEVKDSKHRFEPRFVHVWNEEKKSELRTYDGEALSVGQSTSNTAKIELENNNKIEDTVEVSNDSIENSEAEKTENPENLGTEQGGNGEAEKPENKDSDQENHNSSSSGTGSVHENSSSSSSVKSNSGKSSAGKEKEEASLNEKKTEIIEEEKTPLSKLNRKDRIAYLEGYPDGTIRPNGLLTREEVAAIFFRLLDAKYREEVRSTQNKFTDVSANRWSNLYISTLVNANIIEGYPEGTFKPANNITRAELSKIVFGFEKLNKKSTSKFTDIKGHWAEDYINSAFERGWNYGEAQGEYKPDEFVTRAEFAYFMNKVLDRESKEGEKFENSRDFSDLTDQNKWYYIPMKNASNGSLYSEKNQAIEVQENQKAETKTESVDEMTNRKKNNETEKKKEQDLDAIRYKIENPELGESEGATTLITDLTPLSPLDDKNNRE